MKYLISSALLSLLMLGCSETLTRVKPYEKEHFADTKMTLNILEGRTEHEGHIFLIREASAGGDSTFQGGCGCR